MRSVTRTYSRANDDEGASASTSTPRATTCVEDDGDHFVYVDNGQTRSSARHYEAQFEPKRPFDDEMLRQLRACAGYQGTETYGKVHVLLEKSFWTWLKTCDSTVIRQAYVDAAYILGVRESATANRAQIMREIHGEDNDMDFHGMKTRQENADVVMQNVQARMGKGPFARVTKEERADYAAQLHGADLKPDLELFKRAQKFVDEIAALTLKDGPAYSQNALQKLIWRDKEEAKLIVVALKRLSALA